MRYGGWQLPLAKGLVPGALGVLLVSACSGTGSDAVRPPASRPPTGSPSATSGPTPSPTRLNPKAAVSPAKGLVDRQLVTVTGSGFAPGTQLQVIECASKGTATTSGDCALDAMTPVTATSDGSVSVSFHVRKGPFGANAIVCSRKQPCLVSVTEASLHPTQEADAPITFSGP